MRSQENEVPVNHPLLVFFRKLTDRALTQTSVRDKDLLFYLSELLLHFVKTDNLYTYRDEEGRPITRLAEMMAGVLEMSPVDRKKRYKHIGDFSLFMLGMYPECVTEGRRGLPAAYYEQTGRTSYLVASALERKADKTVVFRKLADRYHHCVRSLNWVRSYTSDPFYQYMLRQYGCV